LPTPPLGLLITMILLILVATCFFPRSLYHRHPKKKINISISARDKKF